MWKVEMKIKVDGVRFSIGFKKSFCGKDIYGVDLLKLFNYEERLRV